MFKLRLIVNFPFTLGVILTCAGTAGWLACALSNEIWEQTGSSAGLLNSRTHTLQLVSDAWRSVQGWLRRHQDRALNYMCVYIFPVFMHQYFAL